MTHRKIAVAGLGLALAVAAGVVSVSAAVASQAAPNRRGAAFFTTCVGCHGNNGEGRPEMFAPPLAGQSAVYLSKQLHDFRAHRRGLAGDPYGHEMASRAAILKSDADVADVVAYISTLPAKRLGLPRIGANSDTGQLFAQTCAACHGAQGEGGENGRIPALNTLSTDYVETQMKKFRSGLRGFDPADVDGATMAGIARSIP